MIRESRRSQSLILKTVLLVSFSLATTILPLVHGAIPVVSPVSTLLTGLNFPVSLKFALDGRIFYTEKDTGNIRIIQKNGTLLPTPFATITPIFTDGEAGLLGIALDPAFSSNNYVYVYYTYRDSGSYTHGHIVRYAATGNTGTSPRDIFDVTTAHLTPSTTTAATSSSDPTASSTQW